jgi:hypothetical protein
VSVPEIHKVLAPFSGSVFSSPPEEKYSTAIERDSDKNSHTDHSIASFQTPMYPTSYTRSIPVLRVRQVVLPTEVPSSRINKYTKTPFVGDKKEALL